MTAEIPYVNADYQQAVLEEIIEEEKMEELHSANVEHNAVKKKRRRIAKMKSRREVNVESDDLLENLHNRDFYQTVFKDTLNLELERDSFTALVEEKAKDQTLGLQAAELEVAIDELILKYDSSPDKALLSLVALPIPPSKELLLVTKLLQRGANAAIVDETGKSALHFTVRKNNITVAEKLLEYGAKPLLTDKVGSTPLNIAIANRNDSLSGLLLRCMNNYEVRELFSRQAEGSPVYTLNEFITLNMKETILAVLDSLIEVDSTSFYGDSTVYYSILEADKDGFPPDSPKFNKKDKSCLHLLAYAGDEEILAHPVISLLVSRKWDLYARKNFIINALTYLIGLVLMTVAVILSLEKTDPRYYDLTAEDIVRAVCELIAVSMSCFTIISEVLEFRGTGKDYFKDEFNLLDAGAALFLLIIIPVRYTGHYSQWAFYSVAYCLSVNRLLKYTPIFRNLRSYVKIMLTLIRTTFVWFLAIFVMAALAFTGSFALAIRVHNPDKPLSQCHSVATTKNFGTIFIAAVRIMIQSDNDEVIPYFRNNRNSNETKQEFNYGYDYGVFAAVIMAVYLFVVLVILLNILIAQLTDVYESLRQDSQVEVDINRAWIVVKVELHSLLNILLRKEQARVVHYLQSEGVSADKVASYKYRMEEDDKSNLGSMATQLENLDCSNKLIMDKLKSHNDMMTEILDLLRQQNMKQKQDVTRSFSSSSASLSRSER